MHNRRCVPEFRRKKHSFIYEAKHKSKQVFSKYQSDIVLYSHVTLSQTPKGVL